MSDLFVSQEVVKLLHNKYVVIIGDSVQRGVYKDLIVFLQSNAYMTIKQMRQKGEFTHCNDKLLEGGQYGEMRNDTSFREVRQYQTDFHLVRFYFVTRVFSEYMETVLKELTNDPKPDVIIINSCLWDITDSSQHSVDLFKENIKNLMKRFNESIPEECLVIWLTCPPIKGGVQMGKTAQNKPKSAASLGKKVVQVYPELEFLQVQRRLEIMAANMYARQVVVEYGYDVLDMHYFFRRHLHRRIFDGIHWDMTGHRRISNLILTHIAEAWGETLPNRVSANSAKILKPLSAVEVSTPKPPVPVQKRQIKKANKRIKAKNRQPTKVQPVRPQKQFHASPGNFSQNCNWTSDNIDFTDDSIPMSNYFCNNTPNYSGFDNYRHQQQSPRMGYQNNAMRPSGQYQGPSGQWGAGYNTDQVNNHVLGLVANIFQSFASGGMGNSRGRPRGPGPQNQNNRYQPYY